MVEVKLPEIASGEILLEKNIIYECSSVIIEQSLL